MSKASAKERFRKFNLTAIILLFVVILAGGVVRSSGSGMGCPDWPKCFGGYIPPTNVSQLPADYKEKYVAGRKKKNDRFAKTLDVFGYSELATRIREDKSILVPEEFNAVKTWIEYANRIAGVLSGIFLLLTAIYSFNYRGINNWIPVASVFNLLLVVFQGWLGSIVVSTNLVAWIVTVHMLLALAILALCIYSYHAAKVVGRPKMAIKGFLYLLAVAVLILSIVQITFGTSVREKIDEVSAHLQGGYRQDWVAKAGDIFNQHRDIALAVFVLNVMLYGLIRKSYSRHSIQQQIMSFIFLMIMLQIGTGIALSYFALPPFAQASHIVLASLVFGAQFYLLLNLSRSVNNRGALA
ncbi:COX15/CtaA family protein [Mucilaginibacter mali]|uniref:COX15/CtaA family protein n=1 Tax=Mucilaginibacter mali TaxID=2740462 RepID=A0A7D4Q4Q1_9SPHI|nr:COX15/CtaA family protein [Mucilaginibacter mali]QKJ31167.1 COX15/CtaA family protein [Mucilaginibacter mali]